MYFKPLNHDNRQPKYKQKELQGKKKVFPYCRADQTIGQRKSANKEIMKNQYTIDFHEKRIIFCLFVFYNKKKKNLKNYRK